MWWQRIIERRRRKRDTAGPDIAFWRLQSMFNNFRRILELNNAILESVADMDRALGGEYIFDRTYLEQSVRRIASHVHHVVYSLNALTGNAHVPLYDRYQDIRIILDDILAGDMRALAGVPVLPLGEVGWELEPLAGMEAVCMAELLNHSGIAGLSVARGCVLTTEGTDLLLGTQARGRQNAASRAGQAFASGMPDMPSASFNELAGLRSVNAPASPLQTTQAAGNAAHTTRKALTAGIAGLLRDEQHLGLRVVVSLAGLLTDALAAHAPHTEDYRHDGIAGDNTTGGIMAVVRMEPDKNGGLKVTQESASDIPNLPPVPQLRAATQTPEAYAGLVEHILQHCHRHLTGRQEASPAAPRITTLLTRLKPAVVHGSVTSRTACHSLHGLRTPAMPAYCLEALGIEAVLPAPEPSGITAAAQGRTESTPITTKDRYLLQRTYPYSLMESEIGTRPAGFRFPDGKRATSVMENGNGRGSSLLRQHTMRGLAETAMTMERMLGLPVTLHWELDAAGDCRIVRVAPALPMGQGRDISGMDSDAGGNTDDLTDGLSDALAAELETAEVLSRKGHMVQSGVVAGKVVHVTDTMRPQDFPAGSIAVTQTASPRLTPILQRASAIVCENGTIAGHLATVARELRLPAIFGVDNVFTRLPEGVEVTMDAGETTIYKGVLPALLQFSTAGADLYPTAPEYHTLRRLLRFIAPLHLVNPEAPEFSPAGCRTFHDLIHYCHEKAVDELAHFQERRPGLGAIRTRRMHLGRPMDLRVLDISGGLVEDVADHPTRDDVISDPFTAFLEGLLRDEAWDTGPVSLGLRDVINSMPLSMSLLSANANTLGENLAIISQDYVNISLRLGYHFSVVDAYLGPDRNRNHVYFRFAGGLADPERRNRRAKFLRNVLEDMGFKVVLNGDLVVASLKQEEPDTMRGALLVLGALTAYSRQRDTALYSDADMHALYDDFAARFLHHFGRFANGKADSTGSRPAETSGSPLPDAAARGSESEPDMEPTKGGAA
ncbi:MAG: PEP-utilizing enzyme [Halodesulfovibrio sp.]